MDSLFANTVIILASDILAFVIVVTTPSFRSVQVEFYIVPMKCDGRRALLFATNLHCALNSLRYKRKEKKTYETTLMVYS